MRVWCVFDDCVFDDCVFDDCVFDDCVFDVLYDIVCCVFG